MLQWKSLLQQHAQWVFMVMVASMVVGPGCGGVPEPIRLSRVAGYIPADTPYAVVTSTIGESSEVFQERYREVFSGLAENFFVRSFRETFQEALGIDILDPETLSEMGLDLRGDVALFGIDLHPSVLVRLEDRARFRAFVDELLVRNPHVIATDDVVDGESVYTIHYGRARITYAEVGGGYLLAILHRGQKPLKALLKAYERGRPSPILGRSVLFRDALAALGPGYDTVLVVNFDRLDSILMGRASVEDNPRLDFLSGDARARFEALEEERLGRCAEAGRSLVGKAPWMVMGLGGPVEGSTSGEVSSQRILVPLSPDLTREASSVLRPLSVDVGGVFGESSAMSFGFSVDFASLVALEGVHAEHVFCPNLAALSGAVGLLSERFGGTDAADVLGPGMYGAIEDFDFLFAGLSNRKASLHVESKDPGALRRGLELLFQGLGFSGWHDEEAGMTYVDVGPVSAYMTTREDSVWVGAGPYEPEEMEERLAEGSVSRGDFAYFRFNGPPLAEILKGLISQLNFVGVYDTRALEDLVVLIERVNKFEFRARIYGGFLEVEGVLDTSEGSEEGTPEDP